MNSVHLIGRSGHRRGGQGGERRLQGTELHPGGRPQRGRGGLLPLLGPSAAHGQRFDQFTAHVASVPLRSAWSPTVRWQAVGFARFGPPSVGGSGIPEHWAAACPLKNRLSVVRAIPVTTHVKIVRPVVVLGSERPTA